MDGALSENCKAVEDFAIHLKSAFGIEVVFQDERLSTVASLEALMGKSPKKKKMLVDNVAAMIILQNYLDKINNQKEKKYE